MVFCGYILQTGLIDDNWDEKNQRFRFAKESGIDIKYRFINYLNVSLDNKCPSIDIYYPKRTK